MRRFTITSEQIDGDRVAFDREETRHLARVLRLRPGDVVVAVDGRGHEYTVRLETLGDRASGTVLGTTLSGIESPLAITLIQGIPKGDRMESIVRDATELGVARIVAAVAERTVVRREPDAWHERTRRWQRVAREAAKQCGRAVVPDVTAPRPLPEALDEAAGVRLCLWEAATQALAGVLDALPARPSSATVLIGPEGGLTAAEVDAARRSGFASVRVGPRILRTETAGPAVIAIVQSRYGDL
ncbi:MAG: 16S rRNA (uracil(1498)-N(3))-methyltransferase [Candidatus Rokuibacteriota bacterium]